MTDGFRRCGSADAKRLPMVGRAGGRDWACFGFPAMLVSLLVTFLGLILFCSALGGGQEGTLIGVLIGARTLGGGGWGRNGVQR